MKKLLLTLAAGAFFALGANAQNPASVLYITGDFGSSQWNADSPYEMPVSNNTYTYVFPTNSQPTFKISTAKGGWSAFDGGAMGPGTLTVNKEQKLSANTANIVTPAAADYTLTITYKDNSYYMLLSTPDGETPEVVAPEKVYIRGDINGWGGSDDNSLSLTSSSVNSDGYYVYTGTIASLYGEFKLSGSASAWQAPVNYGSGDQRSPIIGQRIESWYDGQNFQCSGSFTDVTLTFYWNPTSGTASYLEASTDGGTVTPSYPEKLYIVGSLNSYDNTASNSYILNPKDNEEGVYEGTFDIPAGKFQFRFFTTVDGTWNGSYQIGAGTADSTQVPITFTNGKYEGSYTYPGGMSNWEYSAWEGGNVTLTVDMVNQTVTFVPEEEVTNPTEMWLVGEMNNWDLENKDYVLSATEDGVYSGTFSLAADQASFKIAFGTDWGTTYGNKEDQELIIYSPNNTVTTDATVDGNNWTISNWVAGSITVTLNINTNEVTLYCPNQPQAPAAEEITLYLVGDSVNGVSTWDTADNSNLLTYNEADDTYVWTGTSLSGKFKINDGSWTGTYNLGAGENTNIENGVALDLVNNGNNIIIPDDATVNNPKVVLSLNDMTVTLTGDFVLPEIPYVPEVIYFNGSFNNWASGVALTKNENGLYVGTVEFPASENAAEFKLDCGNDKWYGAEGDSNVSFGEGMEVVLGISATGDNWTLVDWEGGNFTATVNWEEKTLTLNGYTSAISSLQNEKESNVIYNLQGVRVDSNKLTKGIYIINGKKVLVK